LPRKGGGGGTRKKKGGMDRHRINWWSGNLNGKFAPGSHQDPRGGFEKKPLRRKPFISSPNHRRRDLRKAGVVFYKYGGPETCF